MKERIEYFDNAKALLIALAVVGHTLIYANPDYAILPYALAQSFIYAFHMPAFFLLSGMLFDGERWRESGWGTFLRKRLKSLMIPYLSFELFAIAYKQMVFGEPSITTGLYNLVTFRCNIGADWFLPALFLAQLLMFCCAKTGKRWPGWVLTAAALCLPWLFPEGNWWRVLGRGLLGFAFLYLGNRLRPWLTRFRWWSLPLSFGVTAVCAALSFLWFENDFYGYTLKNPVLFVIGGLSGAYMTLSLARLLHWRWLRWVGEHSLVIMGTHQLVLYTIPAASGALWVMGTLLLIAAVEAVVIPVTDRCCPSLVGSAGRRPKR